MWPLPAALLLTGLLAAAIPAWAQVCKPGSISATTPTARFDFDAGAETAADTITGLTWQRCALGQLWIAGLGCQGVPATYTWEQALDTAASQAGGGWRLPTVKELASIVELQCYGPAINLEIFPNAPDGPREGVFPPKGYWSSTPSKESQKNAQLDTVYPKAWFVDAYEGYGNTLEKQRKNYVRLVKDTP